MNFNGWTKDYTSEEDFYDKSKRNFEYNEDFKKNKFLYDTLLSVSNISTNRQFNIIGNLLANEVKISKLLKMPDTNCLQIEDRFGEYISIINKNNMIHLSSDNEDVSFKMIIEKVKDKRQLQTFSDFFKDPKIISFINDLIKIKNSNYMTYTIKSYKIYALLRGDYFVFTGEEP